MPAPVSIATPAPIMAVEACSRMVEAAATKSCVAAPVAQSVASQPNWDALATALAQQSNAIAWGSVLLTIILFAAGLAWGKIIIRNAEKEAREEARQCFARWIAESAPYEISLAVDKITSSPINGNDANRADDIGEQA